jgi:uncharacterized protein YndB with AHSA1/START domain
VSYELTVERLIEAPAEVVFDAFTDAAAQRVWMRDRDDLGAILETECDLRVGGAWVIAWGPSRERLYRESNVFQVVDRPRRTEVTFEERDGKTQMTVVQRGFPTAELRDYFATTAWANVLGALDRFVRGKEQPA